MNDNLGNRSHCSQIQVDHHVIVHRVRRFLEAHPILVILTSGDAVKAVGQYFYRIPEVRRSGYADLTASTNQIFYFRIVGSHDGVYSGNEFL